MASATSTGGQKSTTRFVFLEFESAQRHPSTNVAKCWPWLKQHPQRRVLFIHAYETAQELARPKGSRRELATFIGAELGAVLDGRFRYVAIDAPPDASAVQAVVQALATFRSPSDALDHSKPLFVYGFLRPGELAYHQLADYVTAAEPAVVRGTALERDGLLLVTLDGEDEIAGDLLHLEASVAQTAYRAVDELEPRRLYRWDVATAFARDEAVAINLLVAARPARGSHRLDYEWSSRNDPLFNEALEEIEQILDPFRARPEGREEIRSFFRYQMAYLLLWSAIERYSSLRWGFRGGPVQRVKNLAQEPAFVRALQEYAQPGRVVHRADDPGASAVTLDPTEPLRAIDFYYQVRSNITHRGKAAHEELSLVAGCLSELTAVFRVVLDETLPDGDRRRANGM